MTDKETATTPHGTVEYDVVECSSCGNKVAKNDTKRFVIGEVHDKEEYNTIPDKWQFKNESVGWACEYCQDNPVSFPQVNTFKNQFSNDALVVGSFMLSLAIITIGSLVLV
jgi:hypothetical protein